MACDTFIKNNATQQSSLMTLYDCFYFFTFEPLGQDLEAVAKIVTR